METILTILWFAGAYNTVAMTSQNYDSPAACLSASETIQNRINSETRPTRMTFVCTIKDSGLEPPRVRLKE